jgi:hypothetical protein
MRSRIWLVASVLAPLVVGCEAEPPKTAAKPQVKTREILNKKTQRVFELGPELQKGAVIASTRVDDYDPISGPGKVYQSATNKLSGYAVQQALDIYRVQNDDKYPQTFQEFMDQVMQVGKPDGIWLPERPYYQEYAYDVENHRLVVLNYPERKAQFQDQQDRELGRK